MFAVRVKSRSMYGGTTEKQSPMWIVKEFKVLKESSSVDRRVKSLLRYFCYTVKYNFCYTSND